MVKMKVYKKLLIKFYINNFEGQINKYDENEFIIISEEIITVKY